mmetsp:Transcript_41861/g.89322  ORF Transcript_41861/g.89322 Transcript_41861/m.89322 type:complete len:302 (-) Transcript_41861:201-1106(-)|eukprot:CAMPEP_0183350746 /NCGR_PEP_ID=MMETSP0164_2-20130417/20755_1 /TAXON_ID=221442 /ORGANISM="Coccolithus pelagicus ssp braarudi, Strain PLY182g" /LENGTH=301 /DNA_ID=CAMNT_0025522727 /DNA_START=47 /DNA_END=952 /DNA_ORIENTATION=-
MSDAIEKQLAEASKGYMSKDEYKRKREELEAQEKIDKLCKANSAAPSASGGKKKKGKKEKGLTALSFGDELDAEQDPSPRVQPKKMGKCQDVDVSFLKKNEREAQEAANKHEEVARDYIALQQKAKQEPVELKYTFRSEATQRETSNGVLQGTIKLLRGNTAEEVARAVRTDVEDRGEKFRLLTVAGKKEEKDLIVCLCANGSAMGSFIIPSAMTLVEAAMLRWVEDTSLFEEFKDGIVVTERRWYDQMRHTFPYSRWVILDVHKSYSQKEFIANRNGGQGVDPMYTSSNRKGEVTQRIGR